MGRSIAFVTLGCKLNYSETSTYAREFSNNGFTILSHTEIADIYVINTCSVTEHSDKKCRNIIRKLHRMNPNAIIAVTGCYAQLKPDEIVKIEGVDIVLGAEDKCKLYDEVTKIKSKGDKVLFSCDVQNIETFFPAYSTGERTRSFLKVQDGCDYYCSYCTVPLARGKSRNYSISSLVEEAHRIAQVGIKEIVLTGVNIGDFGRSTNESFIDLLKELNSVNGIERYRISSIEPNLLSEQIVKWIASGTKFLPHFHIPLQSGSDAVLSKMRRRYTTQNFREKISMIRSYMEYVFFGLDVIVGFPGESDEMFEETYSFLEEINPAFLHVFPYSVRPNTLASKMPDQVGENIKNIRVKRLEELSDRLHHDFCSINIGREEEVLFESSIRGGKMYGYTKNYIRVEEQYDKAKINRVCKVIL